MATSGPELPLPYEDERWSIRLVPTSERAQWKESGDEELAHIPSFEHRDVHSAPFGHRFPMPYSHDAPSRAVLEQIKGLGEKLTMRLHDDETEGEDGHMADIWYETHYVLLKGGEFVVIMRDKQRHIMIDS